MINLAMDTAGSVCAACLYDSTNNTVLAEISEEIGRGHAERLMAIIGDVLAKAEISYHDIGKIVTTIGPGSFTGIRVGVATARGFGIGLGIPVVGVTNLEAMLAEALASAQYQKNAPIGAVMQAGRGQAYCQFSFDTRFEKAQTPFLAPIDELTAEINAILPAQKELFLCGNFAVEFGKTLASGPVILDGLESPPISVIAHIGAERSDGGKAPEPLYIRKPDAKPQAGFAVERSG